MRRTCCSPAVTSPSTVTSRSLIFRGPIVSFKLTLVLFRWDRGYETRIAAEFDRDFEVVQKRGYRIPDHLMIHDWAFTDTHYIIFGNRIRVDPLGEYTWNSPFPFFFFFDEQASYESPVAMNIFLNYQLQQYIIKEIRNIYGIINLIGHCRQWKLLTVLEFLSTKIGWN